jgi:hypothetical protein
MKKQSDVEEFVESGLDRINSFGEFLGKTLGSMGRTMQKVVIGVGILVIFGMAVFLWAMGNGMFKKK